MIVFRLGRTKWRTDLSGEGARLNGGRWNNKGVPCIYTSASRALAVLEYSAHNSIDLIPRALSFTTYEIPTNKIFACKEAMLPGDWKQMAYSKSCKDFGSKLLQQHLAVQLPSAILPYEYNYLLNPLHPDFGTSIRIVEVQDYVYDLRIKQ